VGFYLTGMKLKINPIDKFTLDKNNKYDDSQVIRFTDKYA